VGHRQPIDLLHLASRTQGPRLSFAMVAGSSNRSCNGYNDQQCGEIRHIPRYGEMWRRGEQLPEVARRATKAVGENGLFVSELLSRWAQCDGME
jgi:hypothetical protein